MNRQNDNGTTGAAPVAGADAAGVKTLPAMIRDLLKKVESKIGEGDLKALGDYLKLVQMLKELEEDEPREIKVTWVKSAEELKAFEEQHGE